MPIPPAIVRLFSPAPNPMPVDTISITPDMGSITYGSLLPGGYNGLTVSIEEQFLSGMGMARRWPGLALYPQVQNYGHVEVWMNGAQVWEGRGVQLNQVGAEPRGFLSSGYALTATADTPFYSIDGTGRTAGVCLAIALQQAAPLLRRQLGPNWVDSGVPHSEAEFDGKTVSQIAAQLSKEGDGSNLFDFCVWNQRQAYLTPRSVPLQADYYMSFSDLVTLSLQGTQSYSSVVVEYGSGQAKQRTTPVSLSSFATQLGVAREQIIQGGGATAQGAQAYAGTQLAQVARFQYSVSLKLNAFSGATLACGGEIPCWLVKVGQWVQVGNLGILPIIKAEYTTASDSLSVDLGLPPPIWEELIREQVRRTGHFVYGTNPNTGASA